MMAIDNGTNKSESIENNSSSYVERLKKQEAMLHELLIEQTQALKIAHDHCTDCKTAVEATMRQLEEVRHHLYRLWQQAP
jgi:chromosome segregation ATPase